MEKAEIKKNGWIAWSEDEVKLLKRFFPRGRAREITEQTGRPLTAVKADLFFYGLSQFPVTPFLKIGPVEIQNCINNFALKNFLRDWIHFADLFAFGNIAAATVVVSSYPRPV